MVSWSGNYDRADKHWFTTSNKWEFSKAAATRSLSASCLLTACSEACVPGVIWTSILNLSGSDLISFTFMDRPISVAMLQCGIVGVNSTATVLSASFTLTRTCSTTFSSSRVRGCSGSLMERMRSKISRSSMESGSSSSSSRAVTGRSPERR